MQEVISNGGLSVMESLDFPHQDHRMHKRYIVCGIAIIESECHKGTGRVVSVGGGGLLLYCDLDVPVDSRVHISFSLTGIGEEYSVITKGKVVWTQPGRLGVEFVDSPMGLSSLLTYLQSLEEMAEV